jgi:hypothetical protein
MAVVMLEAQQVLPREPDRVCQTVAAFGMGLCFGTVHRTGWCAAVLREARAERGISGRLRKPDITTFDQLVACADTIINGDAKAVAAGFPAMQNPAAAEIVPILADVRTQPL